MSQDNFTELEKLKIIYSEIIDGSSYIPEHDIYIKHFSELDNTNILRKKQSILSYYLKNGTPSQSERLKNLIEECEWSEKEEENIANLKLIIIDNQKNIHSIIPQQRPLIEKIIKEKNDELNFLLVKKRQLLGATAEYFTEQDIMNYIIGSSMYKDKECTIRLFKNQEEFENLDDEQLNLYINITDKTNEKFTYDNIKKISCLSFFINNFSHCKDNIYSFLNIPLSKMTINQLLLFSIGGRNLSILSQSENEPPIVSEDSDIQKCVNWFDQNYSILIGKRNSSKNS